MADDSFQEKTEEATPRKLAKAREEGKVAKSVEFNSVFILLFGLMALNFISTKIFTDLKYDFRLFYQNIGDFDLTIDSTRKLLTTGIGTMLSLIAPFVGTIAMMGIVVNVVQVGFVFTTKPLEPNLAKLNPITGFSKFFNLKSSVELVKGIFKLIVVGGIAYVTLKSHEDDYLKLIHADIADIISFIGTVMFQLGVRTLGALLVLAILDLIYQRWQFKKDMKMSKEEVKDESKQAEGDPQVKTAIRSLQLSRARQRMMDKVPEADVVITNPTELAIALKYDPENMGAPVIVAKGQRLIARKIREVAAKHSIPIYENKPLARSLYKLGQIGKEVPIELFHAVAEVFAYVYRLRNRN